MFLLELSENEPKFLDSREMLMTPDKNFIINQRTNGTTDIIHQQT